MTTEQSRLLRVIDARDLTQVVGVEVDPSLAALRCPDSTQWADGGAGCQHAPPLSVAALFKQAGGVAGGRVDMVS